MRLSAILATLAIVICLVGTISEAQARGGGRPGIGRLPAKPGMNANDPNAPNANDANGPNNAAPPGRPRNAADNQQNGQMAGAGKNDGLGPFPVMPQQMQDQLKLTAAQKALILKLQKDVDTRLAKILTPDQRQQLQKLAGTNSGFNAGFNGKGGDAAAPFAPLASDAPADPNK